MIGLSDLHSQVLASREYAAIARHYEGQRAERSQVPYLNHIDEGLWVLDQIEATRTARLAYCLHPLAQADTDLPTFDPRVASSPEVLVATIEYRNVANRYLSFHHGQPTRRPRLSPLPDVNQMLVADKVQNRKDFEDHHASTHPRATRLAAYFREWLEVLEIDEATYARLAAGLRGRTSTVAAPR